MTPEQITRDFVCDPALIDEAKLAIDGLDAYPNLGRFLSARPLDKLIFFADQKQLVLGVEALVQGDIGVPVDDPKVLCGGIYNPWSNIVAINAGYKKNQDVQRRHIITALFSRPDTISVAPLLSFTASLSNLDTVLMIHEISHMIDFKHVREDRALGQFVTEAAISAYDSRRFVSKYAGSCPDEWFAETMSAYVIYPEVLKDFDPLAFSAMRAALES